MKIPKYRPSLSAQELQDCADALAVHNPNSTALAVLRLVIFKQCNGLMVPTNTSGSAVTQIANASVTSPKSDRDLPQSEQDALFAKYEAELMQAAKAVAALNAGTDTNAGPAMIQQSEQDMHTVQDTHTDTVTATATIDPATIDPDEL